MKKISLSAACVLLAGSLMCSSCIGSFSLFNGYEKWQCNMTSNKFVNGIVGLILQPIVGGICLTIEFWTGSNPMAVNKVQTVKGQDGRYYAIKTLKDGYEVKAPNGEITLFTHNSENESWSITQNGITKEIIRFNADGTIQANLQNGEKLTVTNDEAGMQQVREAVYNDNCFALR